MHEFQQFIRKQMDDRAWSQADLTRASGLSAQLVSKLLGDKRPRLARMPEPETVAGLVRAFKGVPEGALLAAAVKALGVPLDELPDLVLDLSKVDDDALLHEVRRRMRGGTDEVQKPRQETVRPIDSGKARGRGAPMTQADFDLANGPQRKVDPKLRDRPIDGEAPDDFNQDAGESDA